MKPTPKTSLLALADGELLAVTGGKHRHKPLPPPGSVTQSNSVGDISVTAPCNSGDISISVTQSNSAS